VKPKLSSESERCVPTITMSVVILGDRSLTVQVEAAQPPLVAAQ
jgi:hypothetical protein